MSIIGSNILAGASAGGEVGVIRNSLRFRSAANAYLDRDMNNGGTGQAFTVSFWVKLGEISGDQTFLYVNQAPNTFYAKFFINADKQLQFTVYNGTSTILNIKSYAELSDPSAWYHIVLSVDSGVGRAFMYVNGNVIIDLLTSIKPSSGENCYVGGDYTHTIGNLTSDFTLAHYILVSDQELPQELPPSNFGQYSATTGGWVPKKYLGTYGTNGFLLLFERYTAGTDSSGNANDFSRSGIASNTGPDHDYLFDVPLALDEDLGNYLIFRSNRQPNPGTGTMINCNLGLSTPEAESIVKYISDQQLPATGKWYFVINKTLNPRIAVVSSTGTVYGYLATSTSPSGNYGVAIDFDTRHVWSDALGGGSFSRVDAAAGINFDTTLSSYSTAAYLMVQDTSSTVAGTVSFNFGQQPFTNSQPDGFAKLNSFTLATVSPYASPIPDGSNYFDARRYSGNGTGFFFSLPFSPGLIWGKATSATTSHRLFDVVRGVTNVLASNTAAAETTESGVTAFVDTPIVGGQLTGYNIGSNANLNADNSPFAAWNWAAGGAPVSNPDGTIPSQISANPTSRFSIVSYTGTGTSGSLGHGLGVGSGGQLFIIKSRDSGTNGGVVFGSFFSSGGYLQLFTSTANSQTFANTDTNIWNISPSSTLLYINTSTKVNNSGEDYIAYCFGSVPGFSAMGTYVGTGEATPIFLGFKPAFVLVKNMTVGGTSSDWFIWDQNANEGTQIYRTMHANKSSAEFGAYTFPLFSFFADGMAPRTSLCQTSGSSFMYMAFAENPFVYSLASA
jgi:hypothetical protein